MRAGESGGLFDEAHRGRNKMRKLGFVFLCFFGVKRSRGWKESSCLIQVRSGFLIRPRFFSPHATTASHSLDDYRSPTGRPLIERVLCKAVH